MKGIVLLLIIAGGVFFGAQNYHIVTTDMGTVFVPKRTQNMQHIFVDTTRWKLSDYYHNREIVKSIFDAGHGNKLPLLRNFQAMQNSTGNAIETHAPRIRENISNGINLIREKSGNLLNLLNR